VRLKLQSHKKLISYYIKIKLRRERSILKMIYVLSYLRRRENILNWSSREKISRREMVHIVRKSPAAGSNEHDRIASASLRREEILDQVT
jgi:hypothetical protein